jgi:hypothetical protein
MQRNLTKSASRKKLWDLFGWHYEGDGLHFLSKNNSLNCGCSLCRWKTYFRRLTNKKQRLQEKKIIEKELEMRFENDDPVNQTMEVNFYDNNNTLQRKAGKIKYFTQEQVDEIKKINSDLKDKENGTK